jgi:hypothetical protein
MAAIRVEWKISILAFSQKNLAKKASSRFRQNNVQKCTKLKENPRKLSQKRQNLSTVSKTNLTLLWKYLHDMKFRQIFVKTFISKPSCSNLKNFDPRWNSQWRLFSKLHASVLELELYSLGETCQNKIRLLCKKVSWKNIGKLFKTWQKTKAITGNP